MAHDQIISIFTLKELPEKLTGTDRRQKRIPPVMDRQFGNLPFNIGRINVTGDGNCGYYVIQLIKYLNHYKILSLQELQVERMNALCESKTASQELISAKRHYLEYLEVGIILSRLVPELNIAVIVQSNVKKSGEKRAKRVYPTRVVSYKPGLYWSFLLMSHGARHYELLTIAESGDLHRASFSPEEAMEVFECCESEYPTVPVDPSEQICFLDVSDFVYF